jgi:hypothetical protein
MPLRSTTNGIGRVLKSKEAKHKKPSPQLLALVGRLLIHQELPGGTIRRIYDPVVRAQRLASQVRAKRGTKRH